LTRGFFLTAKLGVVGLLVVAGALLYNGGSSGVAPTAEPEPAQAVPVQTMAFNQNFCVIAAIAFAGLGAIDAVLGICSVMDTQDGMQKFVACLRGADEDQNNAVDCQIPAEVDPDGTIDVTYEDFQALDLDANQVHAGQSMFIVAFVDDDAGVRFSADEGHFLSPLNNVNTGQEYLCNDSYGPGGSIDPDCDGDANTVGDGAVVARLVIGPDDDLGETEVMVIQEGLGFPQSIEITGTPDSIQIEPLFGKNKIQAGGTAPQPGGERQQPTSCVFGASVDAVLAANSDPWKAVLVVKAFDDEDQEIAVAGTLWDPPYTPNSSIPGTHPFADPQDIGGAATPLAPTLDTGAIGLAFPEFVCSKEETGTMTLTVAFDNYLGAVPIVSGGLADVDETTEIDIEILPPPSSLTLAAEPAQMDCNGTNTSTITATLALPDGGVPANGNDVNWNVQVLGTVSPLVSDATDGKTTTVLTPLAPAGTGVPVRARVGEPTRFVREDDHTLDLERTERNPDFLESTIIVQCVAGTGAPAPGAPGAPGGGAAPGGGRPTGPIRGPDTGTGGDLDGRGSLSVLPAMLLFVGAMALIGARWGLRGR
jgi:hypothetical protein